MPTYQYACTVCDHRFDAVQSFSDASLTECPACAGMLRKVFSSVGIVFKGSGFYRTDSRAGAGSTVATSENGSKNGDGKSGETKSESKTDNGKTEKKTSGSESKKSDSGSTASSSSGASKTAAST